MLSNENDLGNIDLNTVKMYFDRGATGQQKDPRLGRSPRTPWINANLLDWVPHKNQATNFSHTNKLQPILEHMAGTKLL